MADELVKKLEGRHLELVSNAAMQLHVARELTKHVSAEEQVLQQHFSSILEMAAGEPNLTFRLDTGEVFRGTTDGAPEETEEPTE